MSSAGRKMSSEALPDLAGRTARCITLNCERSAAEAKMRHRSTGKIDFGVIPAGKSRTEAPSSPDLPFFRHRPDSQYDEYYCGCGGWH